MLLLAIAIGHSGPYGTYTKFDLFPRMAFFILVIMLPWAIAKLLHVGVRRFLPHEVSATVLNVLLVPIIALLGSALITYVNIEVGLHGSQSFFQIWPHAILVWLVFGFALASVWLCLNSADEADPVSVSKRAT